MIHSQGSQGKKKLRNSKYTDARREGGLSGASEVTGKLGFVKMKLNRLRQKQNKKKKTGN